VQRDKFFISTIAEDAETFGLGIEIAEYCTAWNVDNDFEDLDSVVEQKIAMAPEIILHGPFNELSPAAIDIDVLEITKKRYRQAVELCLLYGAKKLVFHSGYTDNQYYKFWYKERAINFWKEFMQNLPGDFIIVLENVLEDEPDLLLDVVRKVDNPRLKLCIDIGHINVCLSFAHRVKYNRVNEKMGECADIYEWIEKSAPFISHYHIHNNDGKIDSHKAIFDGTIDMKKILEFTNRLTSDATYTIETTEAKESVEWMRNNVWN